MEVSSNWLKYVAVTQDKNQSSRVKKPLKTADPSVTAQTQENKWHPKRTFPSSSSFQDQQSERKKGITNAVAIDCEMVGVADGKESILARVSVVNSHGHCLYDTFVKPSEPVVDYRTKVSGVRPKDLEDGVELSVAQKAVADLLKGRILVGHSLKNDLRVLFISHPRWKIRDTSKYPAFRAVSNGNTPSLKKLAKEILGVKVQQGEHSSVEDARAAMQLYNLHKKEWERKRSKKKSS